MSPRSLFLRGDGETRNTTIVLLVLMVMVAVWIESCALLRKPTDADKGDVLRFSHEKHAKHVKDCAACHLQSEDKKIVRATHAACVTCHAAASEEKPPDDSCLLCHHSVSPGTVQKAERPDYSEATFNHESHEQTACAVCHGNVEKAGFMSRINFPRMEDCVSCHQPGVGNVASADCLTCHLSINASTMPENHKKPDWKDHAHGPVSMDDQALCLRCHEPPKDCETCHSMERPPSHTTAFRAKTHGFHAMDNPNKCQVCHTQDFCEACHRTTEPINHTAGFKGKPYLHCTTCHLPLEEGNRCAVCHVGDPHERVIADPPPPDLVASGDIRLDQPCLPCHPVDLVPITHPYNTISSLECLGCHRPL